MTHLREKQKSVKCVVWDLDNTVWDGVLLEDERVSLKTTVPDIIRTLDRRGILQSVASKNHPDRAMAKLQEFGLAEFFLYPQISWNSKATSIQSIVSSINIGIDSVAFIDDQPFEREEVKYSLPDVLCIDSAELDNLLDMPEMNPRFITDDSSRRRQMYLSDQTRQQAQQEFIGPEEQFLATLEMEFTIQPAREEDLKRAEELTVRTNQLNTTGYTYSYEELTQFLQSDRHLLLIASLSDKFGAYGKIGLALVEFQERIWTVRLLLMSCRVMSRGVGTIMMNYIMKLAKAKNVRLQAEFVPNGRNRMMYVTYKFANFREVEQHGERLILENDLTRIPGFPDYVKVNIPSIL